MPCSSVYPPGGPAGGHEGRQRPGQNGTFSVFGARTALSLSSPIPQHARAPRLGHEPFRGASAVLSVVLDWTACGVLCGMVLSP